MWAVYALTLPECPVSRGGEQKSLVDAMGLRAFTEGVTSGFINSFAFSMTLSQKVPALTSPIS